jgi:hypothetical protein
MKKHDLLWKVCRETESFFSGEDTQGHNLPDCSCGCKWFVELEGSFGNDWGVCSCVKSPRAGLLTFEHMGCRQFAN